jgi:hypothetical protein
LEKGPLHEGDGNLLPFEPLSPDAVPTSLQASLVARLDAVPAGKEVAQLGSVVGRDFTFEMIQSLSGIAVKRLEQTLGELVQTGLLLARGRPPEALTRSSMCLYRMPLMPPWCAMSDASSTRRCRDAGEGHRRSSDNRTRVARLAFRRRRRVRQGNRLLSKAAGGPPAASPSPKWSVSCTRAFGNFSIFQNRWKRSSESWRCKWR